MTPWNPYECKESDQRGLWTELGREAVGRTGVVKPAVTGVRRRPGASPLGPAGTARSQGTRGDGRLEAEGAVAAAALQLVNSGSLVKHTVNSTGLILWPSIPWGTFPRMHFTGCMQNQRPYCEPGALPWLFRGEGVLLQTADCPDTGSSSDSLFTGTGNRRVKTAWGYSVTLGFAPWFLALHFQNE